MGQRMCRRKLERMSERMSEDMPEDMPEDTLVKFNLGQKKIKKISRYVSWHNCFCMSSWGSPLLDPKKLQNEQFYIID